MPYYISDLKVGAQLIEETRPVPAAGALIDKAASETLLSTVKAFDPVFGEGEFIYLTGVASTAVGDVVTWDSLGQTTRAVTTTRGPIAVAMTANLANFRGWYMIRGLAPVNSGANAVAANAAIQCSAAGTVDDTTTAGQFIDGVVSRAANSGGFTLCQVTYPTMNGR
jgi:hypothetical protein